MPDWPGTSRVRGFGKCLSLSSPTFALAANLAQLDSNCSESKVSGPDNRRRVILGRTGKKQTCLISLRREAWLCWANGCQLSFADHLYDACMNCARRTSTLPKVCKALVLLIMTTLIIYTKKWSRDHATTYAHADVWVRLQWERQARRIWEFRIVLVMQKNCCSWRAGKSANALYRNWSLVSLHCEKLGKSLLKCSVSIVVLHDSDSHSRCGCFFSNSLSFLDATKQEQSVKLSGHA